MKKSAAEAHRMLSNTYGEAAISERTCREWFQRFKNGVFDVKDQYGIWRDQLGVVYYELLKPTKTITAHKEHQTVSFSGCNGVSRCTCGLASLQMRQFCFVDVAIQPEVTFIAKQNSLMKIGSNGNLVLSIRRIYALLDDRFDGFPNQTENKSLDSCYIGRHLGK
ncbi:hypothetical protein TNCV_3717311 [Trichonephila clavipes]|nr:hypothetical protein TNCV_3717311 [Trichonephila clavipes]